MPTWRSGLTVNSALGNTRQLDDGFWHSEYAKNWFGLLRSESVRRAAEDAGLEIVLMAHPNLNEHLSATDLPAHVSVAGYQTHDVQEVLAGARCVITDYSSVVFDAALIERPVLYFQFDKDEFFSGSHIGRPGYFDYDRDGFGPVAGDLDGAERLLVEMIGRGPKMAEPYLARTRKAFPLADGRACERVVARVEMAASGH